MNATRYSTLVFDLDGTLSDPSLGIFRCVNHALAEHALPVASREQVEAEIGPPLEQMLRKLAPEGTDLETLIASYRERYAELGYAENVLYPGISVLLTALGQNGYRMGVCTSKREDFARRILHLFKLDHAFSFVSGGDIGISKAQQLHQLLSDGILDQQAVMIGDRGVDLRAAQANSLQAIGVTWGFGELAELQDAGADALASTPTELLDLLLTD